MLHKIVKLTCDHGDILYSFCTWHFETFYQHIVIQMQPCATINQKRKLRPGWEGRKSLQHAWDACLAPTSILSMLLLRGYAAKSNWSPALRNPYITARRWIQGDWAETFIWTINPVSWQIWRQKRYWLDSCLPSLRRAHNGCSLRYWPVFALPSSVPQRNDPAKKMSSCGDSFIPNAGIVHWHRNMSAK